MQRASWPFRTALATCVACIAFQGPSMGWILEVNTFSIVPDISPLKCKGMQALSRKCKGMQALFELKYPLLRQTFVISVDVDTYWPDFVLNSLWSEQGRVLAPICACLCNLRTLGETLKLSWLVFCGIIFGACLSSAVVLLFGHYHAALYVAQVSLFKDVLQEWHTYKAIIVREAWKQGKNAVEHTCKATSSALYWLIARYHNQPRAASVTISSWCWCQNDWFSAFQEQTCQTQSS